jgi:purine-nucleoside phosphorylase
VGAAEASVSFADLPHLPVPTVGGHHGRAVAVRLADGRRLLVLEGRCHLYEGRTANEVAHAVRAAVLAGAGVVVLTNAAGGINPRYRVGQGVLIADHINLTGLSSLTGPPPPPDVAGSAGRFVDLTDLYSPRLRSAARSVDPTLAEGVYVGLVGPHFETPAEIRLFGSWGADLVGMSTVLEAIAARHLGAEVLGLSLVTNVAAGLPGADLSHDAVLTAARSSAARLGALLGQILVATQSEAR